MFQLSEAEAPARRLPPPPPAPPAQDGTRGPQGAEDEQAGRWGAVPARPRDAPGVGMRTAHVSPGDGDVRTPGQAGTRTASGGIWKEAPEDRWDQSQSPPPPARVLWHRTTRPWSEHASRGGRGRCRLTLCVQRRTPARRLGPARARSRPSLNGREPPSAGSRPAPQVKQLPTQPGRAALLPHGSASRQNLSRGRRTFSSALGRDRRHAGLIPAVPSLLVLSLDRLKSRCLKQSNQVPEQSRKTREQTPVPAGRAAGKKPHRRGASPVRSPRAPRRKDEGESRQAGPRRPGEPRDRALTRQPGRTSSHGARACSVLVPNWGWGLGRT